MKASFNKIIISRTDSIGDVVLTLPLAGFLKKRFPGTKIIFLGRSYTRPVLDACENVDEFADWTHIRSLQPKEQIKALSNLKADAIIHVFSNSEITALAKKAGIPVRIGTYNRQYHWLSCNYQVWLSRRHSPLHEAQLNFKLLSPLGITEILPLEDIPEYYGLHGINPLPGELRNLLSEKRYNLILHPKSKGSAREWGSGNFAALANMFPGSQFRIFVTGTKTEGDILMEEGFFQKAPHVFNLTGRLELDQLIIFLGKADGIVAASTGPLHLAAALGKVALGIYPPIKPMHPGRWAPIGKNASFLVADKKCDECRNGSPCLCMQEVSPEAVYERLLAMLKKINPE